MISMSIEDMILEIALENHDVDDNPFDDLLSHDHNDFTLVISMAL